MPRPILSAALVTTALVLAGSRDARGSGALVGQNAAVSHRVVLAVGAGKTTLFDQVLTSGPGGSFGMIYPVKGEAEVGLSSNVVFSALDAMTGVEIVAPPRNCPPAPPGCAAAPADPPPAPPKAVKLAHVDTDGPYETTRISAADPDAVAQWLQGNGYASSLTSEDYLAIKGYVSRGFDFIAMRFHTPTSARLPRPVRITTTGTIAVLPLGVLALNKPQVTLWVLGAERYEPKNAPGYTHEDLTWYWAGSTSSYPTRPSVGWDIETSLPLRAASLAGAVRSAVFTPAGEASAPSLSADVDYALVASPDGGIGKTADAVREEDVGLLLAATDARGELRATRFRANVRGPALDLELGAASDQRTLGARVPTAEQGEPLCPVYGDVRAASGEPGATCVGGECVLCKQVGTRPRSEAGGRVPLMTPAWNGGGSNDNSFGGGCGGRAQIGPGPVLPGADVLLACGVGACVIGLARSRRRRCGGDAPRA